MYQQGHLSRISFWLHAKNQYNIHSPYVYRLYTEVLSAPMTSVERQQYHVAKPDFEVVASRLAKWYEPQSTDRNEGCICFTKGEESMVLADHPHRSKADEDRWNRLKNDPRYQVSIDLYGYALVIASARLHRQGFLLR